VSYNHPNVGSIDTWKIREKLTPHPGAVWLERLTPRYIHERLVEIIESTPMSNYREAYLWLLAAQIPIAMGNCDCHDSGKPLLDALGDGCGCNWEWVWLLGNIICFTLQVGTTQVLIKWPSLSNKTLVETPIVYANISGYPVLWQLYNETLGIHLAKPVDNKYQVYYSPVEDTVFCDWDRLVEVEQSK